MTEPRCWFCKLPIASDDSLVTCRYKLTGEYIEAHASCIEAVKRATEEKTLERERFARARLAGFVSSLPAFGVRHDSPEFAERVAQTRLVNAAQRYQLEHGNIAFVGPSGCGKSTVAAAIGLRLVDEAVAAYRASAGRESAKLDHAARMVWTTAAALCMARKQHRLGEGEAPEVDRAESATLLFLDELGQEIADDRWLLEFLDVRYSRGLATITTSGLTQFELEARYGTGTRRRLIEPHGLCVDLFESAKPRLVDGNASQKAARG